MSNTQFTSRVNAIRSALKQGHEHVLDGEPVNVTPIRDMIDVLSQDIGAIAPDLDANMRETLAHQLQGLVDEINVLERLISDRLSTEIN